MILGVFLCIQQHFPIDGIELKLMTAKVDKRLDESRHLLYAVGIAEGIVMYLHCQGTAVDDLGHIMLGKGLNTGKRALQLCSYRGGEA